MMAPLAATMPPLPRCCVCLNFLFYVKRPAFGGPWPPRAASLLTGRSGAACGLAAGPRRAAERSVAGSHACGREELKSGWPLSHFCLRLGQVQCRMDI